MPIDDVLLDQGGAVFNVKSSAYGAQGDGITNDSPAIQAALNAAAAAGGTVWIPQGTYLLRQQLDVSSNTTVRGVGEGSLLKADPTDPTQFLRLAGVSNVRITDLAIDVNASGNFVQAITITHGATTQDASRNVWVERCHIFNSQAAQVDDGYTMMAVNARSSTDLWIRDNRVEGMQIKVAGALGIQRVVVTGNRISNPYQYGVSLVGSGTGAVLADCVIADNVITEIGQAGGIYFGSDELGDLAMVCERISVTGNVMIGTLRTVASFIHGAICSTSRDWIIRGNIGRNTEEPAQGNTRGILVAPRDADGVVENLVIADNVMVGADLAGIELRTTEGSGGANGFVIQGNTLERTRGIRVSGPAYRMGRITGNVVRDGFVYLWDCGPVDVHDNTVETDSAAAVLLETSTAGSAVTASIAMNRLQTRTAGTGMEHGIEERGTGTFDVRYFGNQVVGNNAAALELLSASRARLFNASAGSAPVRQLSGSKTYDPPSIAAGGAASTTLTVAGASVGDGVTASFTSISAAGWALDAVVTAADTITVTLTNGTGASADLPSGTLRALVWGY